MSEVSRWSLRLVAAAALAATLTALPAQAAEPARQGSIKIVYEPPTDPAYQRAYDIVRQRHTLEMLQRIFAPFRLPEDLDIKMVGCHGIPNAYFFREDDRPTIRICLRTSKSLN